MSGSYRFKREDALLRALALVERMRPACEKIEIAGSLRRGKATVGDIEIVALPLFGQHTIAGQMDLFGGGTPARTEQVSRLDRVLDELVAAGELRRERPYTHEKGAWGEKYKKAWTNIQTAQGPAFIKGADFALGADGLALIQVDLFIVTPPAQWGPIFAIRTGPGEFGQAIMRYINTHTLLKQNDGYLSYRVTGETVETPTERSYFKALGLAWVEPADRVAAAVKKAVTAKPPTGNGYQLKRAGAPVRRGLTDGEVRLILRDRLETEAELNVYWKPLPVERIFGV